MLLVATLTFSSLLVARSAETIKIAVLGPKGWIQWDGLWEAAQMAKNEINAKGGVLGKYPVELIEVDEHGKDLRPDLGVEEALAAVEAGAQFFVGGFRTECVGPIREALMDYAAANGRPIWFVAGAATSELIDCGGAGHFPGTGTCVRHNYERYKYMFRVTPMNSSMLVKQFAAFMRTYLLLKKMAPMYGNYTGVTIPTSAAHPYDEKVYAPQVKTYVVADDLAWCEVMVKLLAGNSTYPELYPGVPNPYPSPPSPYSVLGPNAIVVGVARPSAYVPVFGPIFDDIDAKNARLIIHIFSAVAGVDFVKTWKDRGTNAIPVGINVESQMQEFYSTVEGKCEYEAFTASVGTRTPIVPGKTDKFWDYYLGNWTHAPIYTAWGAYDAITALAETIEAKGTWPPAKIADIIPDIEKTSRMGLLGRFRYTGENGNTHDVFCAADCLAPIWPYGYVRALMTQWQKGTAGGELRVTWPQDRSYSRKFRIPTLMYALADVDLDFSGRVDIKDIFPVATAFGSEAGKPRWNIEADVNADGKININDIYSIARNFGQSAPQWPLP